MSTHTVPGVTSPTKPSPTTTSKPNRLPAPSLFVGPPSRNASQLSIVRVGPDHNNKSGRPGLSRDKSTRGRDADGSNDHNRELPTLRRPSEKSVDAKWREMQSTLNEVELTAQNSTHVFGESHAAALDDLRNAQIALARAWGRGHETQATSFPTDPGETNNDRFEEADRLASERRTAHRRRADTATSASTVLSDESQLTEDSGHSVRTGQMEDDTQEDIRRAGERREANEAYFKKVEAGVKEVVSKLESVAEAMRMVEAESRSLWSSSGGSMGSEEGKGVGAADGDAG